MANGRNSFLPAMPPILSSRSLPGFPTAVIRRIDGSTRFFVAAFAVMLLCMAGQTVYAQSSEEEAIKKVIRAETDAWRNRDAQAWQSTWLQDSAAIRTIVINNNLNDKVGWENFGPEVMKQIQEDPMADVNEYISDSFNIRTSGDMAWVNYHQLVKSANDGSESASREQRVLLKEDGEWKILSQTTYVTETFGSGPEVVRNNLNAIAYGLYEEQKLEEAIKVLKLNAQLYPEIWSIYNYLGDIYAELGNKQLAIKNYERSLQLNPRNEDGSKALTALKE